MEVYVIIHNPVCAHLHRVDVQDLEATLLVGQRDLHMNFQTAGTKQSLVDHVETIRHSNDENVVELVYTVHLRTVDKYAHGSGSIRKTRFGEELIDNTIANTCSSAARSTLFEDGIELVKDNDVQPTFISFLLVLLKTYQILALVDMSNITNLFLGIFEEFPDIFF